MPEQMTLVLGEMGLAVRAGAAVPAEREFGPESLPGGGASYRGGPTAAACVCRHPHGGWTIARRVAGGAYVYEGSYASAREAALAMRWQ